MQILNVSERNFIIEVNKEPKKFPPKAIELVSDEIGTKLLEMYPTEITEIKVEKEEIEDKPKPKKKVKND